MKISEILKNKNLIFSIEIFPPKPDTDIQVIYDTVEALKELHPDFISVTYGAGGSTRTRTVEIADKIQNKYKITALAHLTCIDTTKDEIANILDDLKKRGIENVMALRGDIPQKGETSFRDFRHASDLVRFIKKNWDFCVGVAGYPEKHPEAESMDRDLDYLKEKVDAGADFITTQLFLENNHFYKYVELVKKNEIKVPVIPGIMTATKLANIERMANLCRVEIPERFKIAVSKCDANNPVCDETVRYTVGQINHLIKNNVKAIHLYTMNKVEQNKRIYFESKLAEIRNSK
ncbi:MAG: methylenetetrahydrofolate reductase [NAD(P)H] [Candidatus Goldbacteria bacterium]|nr:methylenetetrahydrofolate reductase [NAD(P)H] [Candidatus Goldiibacteriota bacterium]